MIRLEHVHKYFHRHKKNEVHAIRDTTFTLEDHGLVCFLGNSGCGKTTLLNVIGGLDCVSKGDVYIDDQKISHVRSGKVDSIRNAYIGYIFQNYNLMEDSTVFDNVAIALRMIGIKDKQEIEKRVCYILEHVGMLRYKNRVVKALSGGERQRVGIARALVKNPKIIIADEPTGNLDSRNTIEIMNIIKAISKTRLVVLVTHEHELARFYATRIIEIVDGKVVSNYENNPSQTLNYQIENKIYLQDLQTHSHVQEQGFDIDVYADEPLEDVKIKLVIKNNHIYLETNQPYHNVEGDIELIDAHYEGLQKESVEDYSFDYDMMFKHTKNIKYKSIFPLYKILYEGFKRIFSYSMIKKILLVGFAFAAAFVLYAFSSLEASQTIKDEYFITTHKNYLTVNQAKITPEQLASFKKMDHVVSAVPGNANANVTLMLDRYLQTSTLSCDTNVNIVTSSALDEDQVLYGHLPMNKTEVVLDQSVANRFYEEFPVRNLGIRKPKDFIGLQIKDGWNRRYTIVGIVESHSPCMYLYDDEVASFTLATSNNVSYETSTGLQLQDYKEEVEHKRIKLVSGHWPEKMYEVILPVSQKENVKINQVLKDKVQSHPLTVVGFYEDTMLYREYGFVSQDTLQASLLENVKNVTILADDKEALKQILQDNHYHVKDPYQLAKDKYVENKQKETMSTILLSCVMLLISLIEMYLMLRSSFLSRIKEVGILRAIGLKKTDLYKMFLGETLAITLITALPAQLLMAYILQSLSSVSYFETKFVMNPMILLTSFIVVLFANCIFGLLPVWKTMRKTPAAILSRNDVN